MSSIFTRIIKNELPSYKIHEDELTISILALDQVNPGHVLVIPKKEVNHWHDCGADAYQRVHLNAQRLAKAITKVTGCPRVGQIVAGFEVPHYHLHLIPAWAIADLDFKRSKKLSSEEMSHLQKSLIAELS
jgi:histidine triad (HIT) family protein